MTVICKVLSCPFWDKRGFCGKGVVKIDENGMCSVIWKKGQHRLLEIPFTEEKYPKRLIEIMDGQTREEDRKEKADVGTNPEDPLNGAAASHE